ncbi:MAG: NADPH-dependent F420 reductase [Candidatus Hodarchaeota archaeon]
MEKKIGLIGGTGPIGQGLALRWGIAGESIILGSRQQDKADRISQQINDKLDSNLIIPRTNKKCIEEADIIIITVPFNHLISTIKPFTKLLTEDHIIVDVTVPLKPFQKGKMIDLLSESEIGAKSATELLNKITPSEIPVIGAFKTISNRILLDVDRLPILTQDVFIFGHNEAAKNIIKEKITLIRNLRPVDAGSVLSARHIEHFTAFLIGLNRRYKTHDCGFSVTGLTDRLW